MNNSSENGGLWRRGEGAVTRGMSSATPDHTSFLFCVQNSLGFHPFSFTLGATM